MTTLAFDGRMGASGDMLLGALVAAGADPAVLDGVTDTLDVAYEVEETVRNGITATRVRVVHTDEDASPEPEPGENNHHHSHERDDHTHEHHEHGHSHAHPDAEGHGPGRSYAEVVELVESMALPAAVEADATAAFEILGRAEAAVHGTDLDATHFHEVGADDAIADVVGSALLFADLDPDRVVTAPVSTGGGEVRMSHGTYPVPAPAVVEVAAQADWAVRGGPVESELLTPTGAAILAHYADGVETLPPLRLTGAGYGAGTKTFPEHPNVLRALVGEQRGGLTREDVAVLETNLDDASPELLGGLQETLREAGARDVSIVPLTMKKSRPGHLVKVVARPEDAARVARRLAVETGTLGVRESGASHRWVAQREFETVYRELDDRHLSD